MPKVVAPLLFFLVRINLRSSIFDINMKALDFTKDLAIPV